MSSWPKQLAIAPGRLGARSVTVAVVEIDALVSLPLSMVAAPGDSLFLDKRKD